MKWLRLCFPIILIFLYCASLLYSQEYLLLRPVWFVKDKSVFKESYYNLSQQKNDKLLLEIAFLSSEQILDEYYSQTISSQQVEAHFYINEELTHYKYSGLKVLGGIGVLLMFASGAVILSVGALGRSRKIMILGGSLCVVSTLIVEAVSTY